MLKINLGCGTNRLQGWSNHDDEVDITRPLPWGNATANYVFAEHVVEHVAYPQAIAFFKDCHRILKPGGVVRIAVPSVERVYQFATEEYGEFAKKWVSEETDYRRRALTNILFRHGHMQPWTQGLLEASLFYAGFSNPWPTIPGYSRHAELCNVEGHDKVIGKEFNAIETVVVEAIK